VFDIRHNLLTCWSVTIPKAPPNQRFRHRFSSFPIGKNNCRQPGVLIVAHQYASIADRASRKLIRRWARLDVLLIDEVGYLNLRPEQTNIFFKLMEERYHRKATLITTNLEYEAWPQLLGHKDLTEALLSRLRHQSQTIHINGPSLREPQG
jgi:DNA replication protein DnaC